MLRVPPRHDCWVTEKHPWCRRMSVWDVHVASPLVTVDGKAGCWPGSELSRVGLQITGEPSLEQWRDAGILLQQAEGAAHW
ncbi:hypothetical protein LCGC14_1933040 [marine sediment metagenome]|uniref:Uncharacterized protein n=1 Tax=marine sediment metagenome TaxID=412755 RepID=A0A0F9FMI3_9ZZZZ